MDKKFKEGSGIQMISYKNKELKQAVQPTDFLTLADFTKEELFQLIEYGCYLKEQQKKGIPHRLLEGKTLAMIFEKPSTRTRVSFETGMFQLGGHALFLTKNDLQLGNGETIADTAKTLSEYVDGIMVRTFEHENVTTLAENAPIPIINGLSNDDHPCQVLADLMTIYEMKGSFENITLTYVGDGNNMAQSLVIGCAIMGINCTISGPEGYEIDEEIFYKAKQLGKNSGAIITHTYDPIKAVQDADIIYTDVWASMGWEDEAESRVDHFKPYQVNENLMNEANEDCLFFHCLPAKRGEEVSADVIDGPQSVVFEQAANRLHIQKSILITCMQG